MNAITTLLSRDATREIAALIETLHRTEQRLEELTAGEVDAVADRDGRTILLREAQEQLRHIEAARQAAILNALPAHIALLDREGTIISVNNAWRRFAGVNALLSPSHGIGVNYLETCDRAKGENSDGAQAAATGIRAVLSGSQSSFSIEYPCHSPTQQRWFLMTVTPLEDIHSFGAVVMHVDVSAERQTEENLRVSESRFRQMAANITDVFFLQNPDGTEMYYVSPAYELIWGRTCESLYLNPRSWMDSIHPDDRLNAFEDVGGGPASGFNYEFRIVRPDGGTRWIHVRGSPILDAAGKPYRIAGVGSDVTQRKLAVDELRKSESLKRAILESSLDCIITIDHEGKIAEFNAAAEATFGLRRDQALGKVMAELIVPPRLRAAHGRGFAHYLATGQGPILGKRMELAAIRADGTEFPIELAITAIGGASTPLFTGFIRDITEQQLDQNRLRESEARFRSLTGLSSDWFWEQDDQYRFVTFSGGSNHAAWRSDQPSTIGLRRWELPGVSAANDSLQEHKALLGAHRPFRDFEYQRTLEDGSVKHVAVSGEPVFDASGRFTGYRGVGTDITERSNTAQEMLERERRFRDMLDNVHLVAVMVDREARITYCNDYLLGLTGWRLEEVFGRNVFDVFEPQEGNAMQTFFPAILADQPEARHCVNELCMRSGERRLISWSNSPLRSGSGDVIGVASIGEDITERTGAEIALRASEMQQRKSAELLAFERSRLLAAQHVAKVGSWEMDLITKSVIWSLETYRIHEVDPATFHPTHQGFLEMVHPDDRAKVEKALGDSPGRHGENERIEHRLLLSNGRIKFVEERWKVTFDPQGRPLRAEGTCQDITDRTLVAEELRTSLGEFQSLAESMPQIVWVTRPDGWTIYINQQWMDYTGMTLEESLGHGWSEPFHPDDRQRALAAWQEALSNSGLYVVECRLRRADGVYRWWLIRGLPLKDATGQILKWFGTCTDIHEMKVAELEIARTSQALRESERRFSDMLQNVELVSMMLDRNGTIEYCNDYMLRLTGRQREEVIGHNWFEIFLPPEDMGMRGVYANLLANAPEAWHHENEILTRSGERRLIRWSNSVLRSGAGEVTGTASIGEDITERKRAEKSLQESRDRLALATRSAHIGIWEWDVGTNKLIWDAQMYALSGIREQDGLSIFDMWRASLHPEDWERSRVVFADALNGMENFTTEFRVVWPSGEVRNIETHFVVQKAASGAAVRLIGANWDITERKRAADEVHRLNTDLERRVDERTAELQAANRELEAFDYSIAHDLMAPIRHIGGFSSILAEEYGDKLDVRGRDLLERMHGAGLRMDQLVGDLLALSVVSRREIVRSRVDLSALALLVFAGMQQADPGRDVEFVVAPGLTAVADLGQMRIVLENLIGNARKFTAQRSGARIEFGSKSGDGGAVLFVRDNGAGFESAWADRLFTPFQRLHTESEFKGTGIGLATVMRIIARHGGKAWAEGKVNEGATFYFTLPS